MIGMYRISGSDQNVERPRIFYLFYIKPELVLLVFVLERKIIRSG